MQPELFHEAEIEQDLPERPWGEMAVVADSDGDDDENPPDDDEEPETLREPPSSTEEISAPSERSM